MENIKFFIETLKTKNELLFYYGILCLVCAVASFVATKMSSVQLFGVSVWLKPFKFFLSTAILAWTMAFYMQFLNAQSFVKILQLGICTVVVH
jgi:hypothetical protein